MTRVYLFLVSCLFAGIGGAVGSMIGNAAGGTGLWVGGLLGGIGGAIAAAAVARAMTWITPGQVRSTAAGAALGFIAAALIAVNTLSSPVGPVLSTLLVGIGALIGARVANPGA